MKTLNLLGREFAKKKENDYSSNNMSINELNSQIFYICLDQSSLAHIFKNQISILVIKITKNQTFVKDITNIFSRVLTIFTNVRLLNFDPSFHIDIEPVSFNWQLIQPFSSSILKELHINVKHIDDCLYLLNGCLKQLEKFYVNIDIIFPHWSTINTKVYSFSNKSII
jgi:hypothetical protein